MPVTTNSSEPLEKISKVYRDGFTKLWLRKNITTSEDEDGNTVYSAEEVTLNIEGDVDISDVSDEQFEDWWNKAIEVEPTINEIVSNLQKITTNFVPVVAAFPSILMRADLSDKEAVQYKALYPEYSNLIGQTVKQGWIIAHEGELYRCGQPTLVISETYVPGATGTESLFSHIRIDEEGYEYWKEWDGITGLYEVDDIVRDPYDEQLYICISPNCTYGPPHSTPTFWEIYNG